MLKGMCGVGLDVPLTENDIFDENGEIVDDKFDEYLMQQDDEDEGKKGFSLLWLAWLGRGWKERGKICWRPRREGLDVVQVRKRGLCVRGGIRTLSLERAAQRLQIWVLGGRTTLRTRNPMIHIGPSSLGKIFGCHMHRLWCFLDIISSDESNGLFDRRKDTKERNRENKNVSPIELLLFGSLRYLGRGWAFDDMRDMTYISRDVHRKFFTNMWSSERRWLYPLHVSVLKHMVEELRGCEEGYDMAGFPGCIGSTDATHLPLEKVCVLLRQAQLGFKSKSTMRTYNRTCYHRQHISHTTAGHPGWWNDKTLIRFDNFMLNLRNGVHNETMDFELRLDKEWRVPTVGKREL